MRNAIFIFLLFASVIVTVAVAQDVCFSEVDGNIPVEMESNDFPAARFKDSRRIRGFSGSSHILFRGPNRYREPDLNDTLEYKVFSPFGGVYISYLRGSRFRDGTMLRDDEANDIWVNGPLIERGRIWVKAFISFGEEDRLWNWSSRLEDEDDIQFRAKFNLAPGVNSIFFSGRSMRFCPDKLNLVKLRAVRNDNLPEARVDCSSGLPVDPSLTSCEAIASQVVVRLYAGEFSGRTCQFNRIESNARTLCSNGICDGASDTVCDRKLTSRLTKKFRDPSICATPSDGA